MPADLSASPIGRTVAISGVDRRFDLPYELDAYLPDSLPERVELSDPTWMKMSDAAQALGRLNAAGTIVPNPQLVTRLATRREAIGTSELEGTFANITDLYAAEAASVSPADPGVPPNVREVLNYTLAADAAYDWITERPITSTLLCNLQAIIVRGTDSDGPEAGAVRKSQVFIGAKDRPVTEARFVPPPPGDQLTSLVDGWISWVNDDSRESMHLVAHLALAHYQFETIHPFTDGNGRVGRLAAVLQILAKQALQAPVLAISDWLKSNASEYRDRLLAVSVSGQWEPWIDFFAIAVQASATAAHDRIMRLIDLQESISAEARSRLPSARLAIEIADDFIAHPMLTVADSERRHGRSNQANRNAINRLCDVGLLETFSDATYDRLYWNPRVFEIIGV